MPDYDAGGLIVTTEVDPESKESFIAYYVQKKKLYKTYDIIIDDDKKKCFDFAYDMSYGRVGAHRNHRAGGTMNRTLGQIFINTFQGKMAEYALFRYLKSKYIEVAEPDVNRFDLGKWDSFDLDTQGKHLSVKSTKSYGDLLLLETKDWNDNGEYIPNIESGNAKYDYTVLVRFSPDGEEIMRKHKLLFQKEDQIPNNIKDILNEEVLKQDWTYDFPGFIYYSELKKMINEGRIIPKGVKLNGKVKMDAENYYFQTGNMHSIEELYLKNIYDDVNRDDVRLIRTCRLCGNVLVERSSKYGPFWGCQGFTTSSRCEFRENIYR